MKIKSLALLSFLFISSMSLAQQVYEVQKPMLTKVTATWCPKCGTWGWEYMERAMQEHIDDVLFVGAHFSGDLRTPVGDFLASNFESVGQPVFFLKNEDQVVLSGNVDDKLDELRTKIQDQLAESPVVNTGLAVSSNGSSIQVHSKTRFFQGTSGDFYLGVYVMEDKVENFQSGLGNAEHPFVAQAAMTSNVEGIQLMNGSANAGMEFENDFTIDIDDEWDVDNIHIYAVVWNKNGSTYEFLNAYSEEIGEATSTEDISAAGFSVEATPTIVDDLLTLQLTSNIQREVKAQIYDQHGKIISQNDVFVASGITNAQIPYLKLSPGLYFVSVSDGEQSAVTKFVVK